MSRYHLASISFTGDKTDVAARKLLGVVVRMMVVHPWLRVVRNRQLVLLVMRMMMMKGLIRVVSISWVVSEGRRWRQELVVVIMPGDMKFIINWRDFYLVVS
jgi:hypothetical protein